MKGVWTLTCLAVAVLAVAQPGTTTRASLTYTGGQADGPSDKPAVSADGRFVLFQSQATNLIPNYSGGLYVRDRLLSTTELVSVSTSGQFGDGSYGSISADGRFVVFTSGTAFVPEDQNSQPDVYLRDRLLGTTVRASVATNGAEGNGNSYGPTISADGRYIAYDSLATNLAPNDSNGSSDVFWHDMATGETLCVSLSMAGVPGDGNSVAGSIGADGKHVVFSSTADDLVPGDTNGQEDVFVRDIVTGLIERVSVSNTGQQTDFWSRHPGVSGDGRFVVFDSHATNLVGDVGDREDDIYLRDRQLGTTSRVSVSTTGGQPNHFSNYPAISADGRYVVYWSLAGNIVPNDTNNTVDIFVADRVANTTERVSVSTTGVQSNGISSVPAISLDGRFVVFASAGDNLVTNDTNGAEDIFLRERVVPRKVVSGQLGFELLDQAVSPPASAHFRVAWNGYLYSDSDAPLGIDGSYSLTVPEGSLAITARESHWLGQSFHADTTAGDAIGLDVDLVNGDVNMDNSVDLVDLSAILVDFAQYGSPADLTGDGFVDLNDLVIPLLNFGMVGSD
jgi:Tol biopolymer transport system component